MITYIHRRTRNTMKSKIFLARSLINRKLGWAKESCWITLLVICEVCLTFLLHPLGTSGKQEGKPMRFSLLSQHTAGTCEWKIDPRDRWTCLELALCTYWLNVNGTGRIGSLIGINSYADASVRKLSWIENQTCEGGGELPVFPRYPPAFSGENSFRYSWHVLMLHFLNRSIHYCSA